jgi:hypothetical protein
MRLVATALALCLLTPPLAAQWLTARTPGIPRSADGKPNLSAPTPRTADGHPDLTGLWDTRGGKIDEPVDLPWAKALVRKRAEDFYKDNPGYQCQPRGPGYHANGGMRRILQTPSIIAILNDDLTYRQIFLDGRTLETDPNPTWMGYSVGRWEGETLVVESAGFNDRTWLDNRGHAHSDGLRMTERYRRKDFGHMEIDVTFADPATYAAPWHLTRNMGFAADTELLEAVCNENPHRHDHWVGKASDAERTAVDVSPEILAKYVGVYRGLYIQNIRTVEVTLVGRALFAEIGGQRVRLVPQSETLFVSALDEDIPNPAAVGLGYTFTRDGDAMAKNVKERHASGEYTYERQIH